MIDVNKIKVGDKLRVITDYLKGIGVDEIVEVVPSVPDGYWINGGFVDINYLDGEEEAFELIDEESEQRIEPKRITTQKIKVLTGDYEYQGLYKDSIHTVENQTDGGVQFWHNGKLWTLRGDDYEVYSYEFVPSNKPIKSDGGSSSYYTIPLPDNVIEKIVKNRAIETEDILKYGLGNDFDFSNAAKSLVRLWGTVNGAGKAGNDAGYEIKKIRYSLNKIEKFFVNK